MAVIDHATARKIVRAAFDAGAEMGLKPLTVAVADSGGHLVALERADGTNPGGCDIARNKAYSAVMMRIAGTRMRELSQSTTWFLPSATQICDGKIFPVPGAVLVRGDDGVVVGSVGITGDTPDNDAACASAAIASVGLTAEI